MEGGIEVVSFANCTYFMAKPPPKKTLFFRGSDLFRRSRHLQQRKLVVDKGEKSFKKVASSFSMFSPLFLHAKM